MLFVTREFFLGFLPIVLAAFHLSLALGLRKLLLPILLIGSVVFYAWGNPSETPILAVSILVNYLTGRALVDLNLPAPRRKAVFILALVFNLGLLAFFKYTNFALDNLAALFDLAPRHINIALPIGISFYTFTQIAFLTDIYRNGERQRDLASYSLFVTYFPHLVAGPIIHWREVMPQFRMLGRKEGLAFASSAYSAFLVEGICLFSIGLIKKLLIADQLSVFVNLGYKAVPSLGFTDAWLLSLAYTFQLYFDFSGYADMAVGISLLFGIRIPYNFNSPYIAVSIQDFWRRWHMTLSRWLRDYLYIPLGGSRHGVARYVIATLASMGICGLWHGAGWTFVAWGLWHGFGLIVCRGWQSLNRPMPAAIGWLLTMAFVILGWVIFRADSFTTATSVMASLVGAHGFSGPLTSVKPIALAALASVLIPSAHEIRDRLLQPNPVWAVTGALLAIYCMLDVGKGAPVNFIYFQF